MGREPLARVGAHVPAARAFAYADQVGAESIQIFVSNPRGWAMPIVDAAVDNKFRERCLESDLVTWVHAPYLINLGSPTEKTYQNSLESISYALERTARIGAQGIVVHTGSAVDPGYVERAWKQIHDGVMPILEALDDSAPYFLLEPTAGQGQSLCKRLDDLAYYFEALENHPKVGVCLDTCHVFAAGHDLTAPGGVKETLDLLIDVVGPDRLKLIHANDSKDVCGALKDRHENIGVGAIGLEPFADLFTHSAVAGVPLILETPGMEIEHEKEIALLKEFRSRAR
ncbi:MAG TPA: deoxyribonuclease IV [Candidatus Nanopelagicaceae bacterium]|nr:deoxyribonuclease IV [Candidatus Nanopelagicaceae bacterium]